MNKYLKLFFISLITLSLSLGLYANGLNLNSNGSKALAMGGAFIGLADDFSAVYWNPAGLIQMKTTNIGIYLTDVIPSGGYVSPAYGIDAAMVSNNYISGSVGFFTPLSDKLVVGIYAYVPSGLGAEWKGSELLPLAGNFDLKWKSLFTIITVSPAIAYQVTDMIAVGATLNIDYGMLKMEQPGVGQYEEDLHGFAFGATFGVMIKPVDKLSFGLTFKTPTKANLSGEAIMSGASTLGLGLSTTQTAERVATVPMWIGAGIAYQVLDKLTITADVQYTNWKKLVDIPVTYDNAVWQTVFGPGSKIDMEWKDAIQIRLGAEYLISDSLAVRAGYYYDPSPAPVKTLNILLPQHTYNWITFGVGWKKDNFNLDFGIEYGIGDDVLVNSGEGAMPGTHSMSIIVPNISFTYFLQKSK